MNTIKYYDVLVVSSKVYHLYHVHFMWLVSMSSTYYLILNSKSKCPYSQVHPGHIQMLATRHLSEVVIIMH